MEKRAKLKQKWALEDSLEIRKKYPPIVLDTLKSEQI
jgi:hypothetical protein